MGAPRSIPLASRVRVRVRFRLGRTSVHPSGHRRLGLGLGLGLGLPRSTPLASRGPTSRPLLAGSDRPAVGRTARRSCTPLRRTRTRTRAQAVGATGAPSAVCVRCGGCVCLCRSVRAHRSWQGVCNGSSGDRPRVGSCTGAAAPAATWAFYRAYVQLPTHTRPTEGSSGTGTHGSYGCYGWRRSGLVCLCHSVRVRRNR